MLSTNSSPSNTSSTSSSSRIAKKKGDKGEKKKAEESDEPYVYEPYVYEPYQDKNEKEKGWERKSKSVAASMAPDKAAKDTIRILKAGKYKTDSETIAFPMKRLTTSYKQCQTVKFKSMNASGGKSGKGSIPTTLISVFEGDTFDCAEALLARGGGGGAVPCVLDFASDSNPGGGWKTKQQGTQEESLARRSSLGVCLEHHYNQVGPATYLPPGSAIYCGDVVVFRDKRYELLLAPFWVTVVACALRQTTEREIRAKIDGVLSVAAAQGQRALVLGAWGCGAFGNDIEVVAREMVGALTSRAFSGLFEEVVFAVPSATAQVAFRDAIAVNGCHKRS